MKRVLTLLLILSLSFIHISPASAKTHKKTHKKSKHHITLKHKTITISYKMRANKAKLVASSRSESKIDLIMRRAASAIGTPYSYGSSGGGTFDCSGFTSFAYRAANIELPHSSNDQASLGMHVDREDLQKGDLVLFKNSSESHIGHVGIYVGDNSFIHASTSNGVTITSLRDNYYVERYVGARRIIK